uniref:Uncharacterized protein n=1 Tax=Cereibacter sphaeroides (strain ATCC 17025 / ATH 2.4.3) TaxID=349102 RepID=A4X0S4_CERS5
MRCALLLGSVLALAATELNAGSVEDVMEDYRKALAPLLAEVRSNPLTAEGYWLEMRNIGDEWEKMILVFGYAGAGDEAACAEVLRLVAGENLERDYRCVPVN